MYFHHKTNVSQSLHGKPHLLTIHSNKLLLNDSDWVMFHDYRIQHSQQWDYTTTHIHTYTHMYDQPIKCVYSTMSLRDFFSFSFTNTNEWTLIKIELKLTERMKEIWTVQNVVNLWNSIKLNIWSKNN